MEKTYIFGHKNPDTDTITSSLVMADFERKLGNTEVEACRLGDINKETEYVLNYIGIEAPKYIENLEDGESVILVDHANPKESIDNLDNLVIKKVVDHHKLGLSTAYPLFYRAEPVGCTETVLYKLYKEYGFEIDKKIAMLMLSAIISDTLLLKSPTTTNDDINAVEELAKIADIDYKTYGLEMLKAGTDLSSYTPAEILKIDAKETEIKGKKIIVAQVNTASIPEVMTLKEDLEKEINNMIADKKLDLFMLLITDIVNSNSQTISLGNSANIIEKSYNVKLENNTAFLPGIVSRKKQVIPVLSENA